MSISVVELESQAPVTDGKTPHTLRRTGIGLFSGGRYLVRVSKPGTPAKSFPLHVPTVRFGGLLGWIIVDLETGRIWQLDTQNSGLEWLPAAGEETFERVTGFVIATLEDVKASPRAMEQMKLLAIKAR